MSKEIPKLSTLVLKEIAKAPSKYLSTESFERANKIISKSKDQDFDITQILINYVTDAGRYTDDVIPTTFFNGSRKELCLKNTKVSSKYIMKILDICPLLEAIDVSGTFLIDDDLVLTILQKCQKLKSLNIRNCRKITESSLKYISSSPNKIESLNIGGNLNITEQGLVSFLSSSKASDLKYLYISGLSINDNLLYLISKKCLKLKGLGINYANVSEDCLHKILTAPSSIPGITIGQNLEIFHLGWIGSGGGIPTDSLIDRPQLTSEFFTVNLVTYCPKLIELDVCGLKNVTANALLQYLDQRLRLVSNKFFQLYSCALPPVCS